MLATGAQPIDRLDFRQGRFATKTSFPVRPGDRGGAMSVRRFVLDPLLADAAADAGAELLMATTVTGLTDEHGRVSGVRVTARGRERQLSARLVVGADGRNSPVAQLTNARKYHVVASERFAYWGFYENVDVGPEPEVAFHQWDGRLVLGTPCDGGLYQVIVVPAPGFLLEFRVDVKRAFEAHARACAPVAAKLERAKRVGKLLGILRWESFFRESAGRGWVLVGDAGHFKDPTPGQGMTDAWRQAAALAPKITGALAGSDARLDAATAGWARWRDRDAFEHHWLACDLGATEQPQLRAELMRQLEYRGRLDRLLTVLQHRELPSRVVKPPLLLATTAEMLMRPGSDRRAVLAELRELVATDRRRKRLRRRPVFVGAADRADAGETEVADAIAA